MFIAPTVANLTGLGFTVTPQPPRSSDFNLLDAFVFPAMEAKCNEQGAIFRM